MSRVSARSYPAQKGGPTHDVTGRHTPGPHHTTQGLPRNGPFKLGVHESIGNGGDSSVEPDGHRDATSRPRLRTGLMPGLGGWSWRDRPGTGYGAVGCART